MSATQCTAINAIKGNRCASKPCNPWGTCRRHKPEAPSEASFAAALAIIAPFETKRARLNQVQTRDKTMVELDKLYTETMAALIDYPELAAHTRMYHLSVHLGVKNAFTEKMCKVLTHNQNINHDGMVIHDILAEKERWAAIEEPLADTLEGLQAQLNLCGRIYADVECADMGCGYQFWQIQAFEKIKARNMAIKEKMAALA